LQASRRLAVGEVGVPAEPEHVETHALTKSGEAPTNAHAVERRSETAEWERTRAP
jgi:hypothetical protein